MNKKYLNPEETLKSFKEKEVKEKENIGFASVRSRERSQFSDISEIWNSFAIENNLSKILKLTESRKNKIRLRLKEKEFNLIKILEAAKMQPFLLGRNNTGWQLNFDFIIKNENNYIKILEYGYAEKRQCLGNSVSNVVFSESDWRDISKTIYENFD